MNAYIYLKATGFLNWGDFLVYEMLGEVSINVSDYFFSI